MTTATDTREDWKVQASYKFGRHQEAMLNVRAGNLNDLAAEVKKIPEVSGDLVLAAEVLRTESVGSGGGLVSANSVDPQGNTQGAGSRGPGTAPTATHSPTSTTECRHGGRVRKSGTSAKGAWVGWFCPLDKNDPNKCQPYFE